MSPCFQEQEPCCEGQHLKWNAIIVLLCAQKNPKTLKSLNQRLPCVHDPLDPCTYVARFCFPSGGTGVRLNKSFDRLEPLPRWMSRNPVMWRMQTAHAVLFRTEWLRRHRQAALQQQDPGVKTTSLKCEGRCRHYCSKEFTSSGVWHRVVRSCRMSGSKRQCHMDGGNLTWHSFTAPGTRARRVTVPNMSSSCLCPATPSAAFKFCTEPFM